MKQITFSTFQLYEIDPSWNSKPKNKSDEIRKQLIDLEIKTAKISDNFQDDCSPSIRMKIDTPILRSNRPSPIISMGSSMCNFPQKFFPTTSTKHQSQYLTRSSANQSEHPTNFPLRKMSISKKKLVKNNKIPSHFCNVQQNSESKEPEKLIPKPIKSNKAREAISKLHEISHTVKSSLKSCLKRSYTYRSRIIMTSDLEKINEFESEKCSTQSNSPERGSKNSERKTSNGTTIPTDDYLLQNEKRRRRHTTQCNRSQAISKFDEVTLAALEKLSLAPVINQ